MPEWKRFKMSLKPLRRDGGTADELTTVRHIVHVPVARRIIEDGKIKAGLVYDESRLNRSRLSVVWVSANTWGPGSIYGTVEFQFSWFDFIADRNIYWVEGMDDYSPPAYRLLLTKQTDVPSSVRPYDPAADDGPLKFVKDKWYWNTSYTSEFMIDEDLRLDRCTGIDFLTHHSTFCRLDGSTCRDLGAAPFKTGGQMLAYLLGHRLHQLDTHLRPTKPDPKNRYDLLYTAISGLWSAKIHRSQQETTANFFQADRSQ